MTRELRQSTAATIKFGPMVDDSDGKTPETGLIISQFDVRLTKNGGDFAQKNESSASLHDENGYYDISINSVDSNTLGSLEIAVYESGALLRKEYFEVVSQNYWDTKYGSSKFQVEVASISTLGPGAITWNYTLTDSNGGQPIADCQVWVTTDSVGSNVIASGFTNQSGVVTFYLDAGTIYVFRAKSGYVFTNPDIEAVS